MKVQEVFKVLLENPNPIIIRRDPQREQTMIERNRTSLPIYSASKGGRYWFDGGFVSDKEIVALFGLAIIIEQKPIHIQIPLAISVKDNDETKYGILEADIDFDITGELQLPLLDLKVAHQIYNERSNGYCNFSTATLINDKVCVELGGELCLDELLAIYSIISVCRDFENNKK